MHHDRLSELGGDGRADDFLSLHQRNRGRKNYEGNERFHLANVQDDPRRLGAFGSGVWFGWFDSRPQNGTPGIANFPQGSPIQINPKMPFSTLGSDLGPSLKGCAAQDMSITYQT